MNKPDIFNLTYDPPLSAVEPAPDGLVEPVAWRYRHWNGMYERWDEWKHVGYQPQGFNNSTFEKEPLYASPVAGEVKG